MLSVIGVDGDFRSLNSETFSRDATFGKRTVIFGHNGSGKSSLAELFYQLSQGRLTLPISWSDTAGKSTNIVPQTKPTQTVVSVFTKSWVRDNLADFLDGDSAASIIALGAGAVEAKIEQKSLEKNIKKYKEQIPKAKSDLKSAQKATNIFVGSIQQRIVDILGEVDRTYTKSRYNAPKVRELLSKDHQSSVTNEVNEQNLQEIKRGPLASIDLKDAELPEWTLFTKKVQTALSENVKSQLIEELMGQEDLQSWIEVGLALHEDKSTCQFCESSLARKRIEDLQNHFDDSRRQLRNTVKHLIDQVDEIESNISTWREKIPNTDAIYVDLHEDFNSAVAAETKNVRSVNMFLEQAKKALKKSILRQKTRTSQV